MNQKTEERKYAQLRKLGQELHIPVPEHFVELEVFDKDGKRIQHLKQRSHSWVRNAYNLLLSEMAGKDIDAGVGEYGAGFLSIKDTAGAIWRGAGGVCIAKSDDDFEGAGRGYRAAAAVATFGILVGSNAGAWTFEQNVLLGPITEGVVAPNQINHIAMAAPTKSYGALTWTITWIRYFNNNGAGNVLVNEVGLVSSGNVLLIGKLWITSRDVLGATVTIPPTGQLKVTYTIQLTYPA